MSSIELAIDGIRILDSSVNSFVKMFWDEI